MDNASPNAHAGYELRFRSREDPYRVIAFPCDPDGRVDLDSLTRASLNGYLYARVFIGRFFDPPFVQRAARLGAFADA